MALLDIHAGTAINFTVQASEGKHHPMAAGLIPWHSFPSTLLRLHVLSDTATSCLSTFPADFFIFAVLVRASRYLPAPS